MKEVLFKAGDEVEVVVPGVFYFMRGERLTVVEDEHRRWGIINEDANCISVRDMTTGIHKVCYWWRLRKLEVDPLLRDIQDYCRRELT